MPAAVVAPIDAVVDAEITEVTEPPAAPAS
jgi:hypothetical protein